MTTRITTAPAQNRYRVTITEQVEYVIDVLAATEEQAEELAMEASSGMTPDSDGGDVYTEKIDDDDPDFEPINP